MRRICVVTGSRADYGHLQPVMRAIAQAPELALDVLVCGQHLDPRFGETWKAIAADGFDIAGRVDLALGDDSALAVAEATGRAVSGIARELARLKLDIVLLLGDRYEILAAGVAALLLGIPIAHLHGGEITEGAVDDAMRHALSKMAALHFVAAEPYARRLIQMGEAPEKVLVTGAPGLDNLGTIPALTPAEIAALKIVPSDPLFLITYHPVTLAADYGLAGLEALLSALSAYRDAAIVFTGVNSDPGYRALGERISAFVASNPHKRTLVASLGQRRYIGLMRSGAVVIGNSSSGLIEAPFLGVPSVNIGERQKGRLRSPSVIDCAENETSIARALARAVTFEFRTEAAEDKAAYGAGNASERIVGALKHVSLTELSTKHFHDIIR